MTQRLASSLITLALVSLVSFLSVHVAPGDKAQLIAGGAAREMGPDALARLRQMHGLDRPWPVQYLAWLKSLARLDLGVSLKTGRPVAEEFRDRIPVSAAIAAASILVAVLVGFGLGIAAVLAEGRWLDHAVRLLAVLSRSAPPFIIGLALIFLFAFKLAWFPLYGTAGGAGLMLPVAALGAIMGLSLARIMRNALLEAVHEEYFLAALGKGSSYARAVAVHALPNTLSLAVTYLGLRFAGLLGGIVLIESVFSLPGLGGYILEAILSRDLPVIQAYILFFGLMVAGANLAADLLVRRLDPRAARARLC